MPVIERYSITALSKSALAVLQGIVFLALCCSKVSLWVRNVDVLLQENTLAVLPRSSSVIPQKVLPHMIMLDLQPPNSL